MGGVGRANPSGSYVALRPSRRRPVSTGFIEWAGTKPGWRAADASVRAPESASRAMRTAGRVRHVSNAERRLRAPAVAIAPIAPAFTQDSRMTHSTGGWQWRSIALRKSRGTPPKPAAATERRPPRALASASSAATAPAASSSICGQKEIPEVGTGGASPPPPRLAFQQDLAGPGDPGLSLSASL